MHTGGWLRAVMHCAYQGGGWLCAVMHCAYGGVGCVPRPPSHNDMDLGEIDQLFTWQQLYSGLAKHASADDAHEHVHASMYHSALP